MKLDKKIEKHLRKKKYVRITRSITKYLKYVSKGIIIDKSDKFVVLKEIDDFIIRGTQIILKDQISKFRFNENDAFYDKILNWEGFKNKITVKTKIDLTDWESIFKSLKRKKRNVIVECENHKNRFVIGKIEKVKSKSVYIKYFDAKGVLEKKLTKVKYKKITIITFDDQYVDIFSKYIKG